MTATEHFAAASNAVGYTDGQRQIMVEAAHDMKLPLDEAADWLDVEITPWGSRAWKAAGFATAAEAAPFRRRGLTADAAYLTHRDEAAQARYASIRH